MEPRRVPLRPGRRHVRDIGIGPVNTDMNAGFDKIWDNLKFGAMGKLRLGYDRWALTTDVLYLGLQGSKNNVTAELDQWMVEPTLSYRWVYMDYETGSGASRFEYDMLSQEPQFGVTFLF